jgi:hypothetical protein
LCPAAYAQIKTFRAERARELAQPTAVAAPAGALAPLPTVVVLATGAVTVNFTGLLSWPPADSVSETALGSPAQCRC